MAVMHFASSMAASAAASSTKGAPTGLRIGSYANIGSLTDESNRKGSVAGASLHAAVLRRGRHCPFMHPHARCSFWRRSTPVLAPRGAALRGAQPVTGVLRRLRERTWSKERSRACCAPFAVRTSPVRDVYVLPTRLIDSCCILLRSLMPMICNPQVAHDVLEEAA